MPIISSSIYDNRGKIYNVQNILTPDFLFDEEAFKKYSPIYLPVTYFLAYAVQFAGLTALLTHTLCFHGADIWQQTLQTFKDRPGKEYSYQEVSTIQEPINHTLSQTSSHTSSHLSSHESRTNKSAALRDVHNRLMERYDDVPIMWYLLTLISMLVMAIFVVE